VTGRLHLVDTGVYAVGRPEISQKGRWMAAVLTCGPEAVLSFTSAGQLWGIVPESPGPIEVSVRTQSSLRRCGVRVHRRPNLRIEDIVVHDGIPVDFHWPDLGLVVETDGLRYHRTPAAQARDRRRDQAHTVAGLTPLRFTHAQMRFESDRVRQTLIAVARRLQSGQLGPSGRE
jgi:very-short-patch-repair endonuclease